MKILLGIMSIIAIIFAYLFFSSNQGGSVGMPPPGQIPVDTDILISITSGGKVLPFDKEGKPLTRCHICDDEQAKKYGNRCEKAPSTANICYSLTNTNLRDLIHLSYVKTSNSPPCGTLWINNIPYPWPPGCGQ